MIRDLNRVISVSAPFLSEMRYHDKRSSSQMAEKEHSQNSVLLIMLYVVYSNGNGLFSRKCISVHGLGDKIIELRSPAARVVAWVSG